MSDPFEWGNVTKRNTRVGDRVYYVTSPERGNTRGRKTSYDLVEVEAFTDERICVSLGEGWRRYVKDWHLFTRKVVERRAVCIQAGIPPRHIRVIPPSIQVRKEGDGSLLVMGFVVESEGYEILARFDGPGKLKKAKELEVAIKTQKTPRKPRNTPGAKPKTI